MPTIDEKELEELLKKFQRFNAPGNSLLRAKNIMMTAVGQSRSTRLAVQNIPKKPFINIIIPSLKFKYMPIVAIILAVILGGGGTVAAAQNDLPGDALYGVKLASEKVAETFAFGDEEKVDRAAKFAERRANEIALLKAKAVQGIAEGQEGAVVPDSEVAPGIAQAADNLEERINKMKERIDELKAHDSEGTLRVASVLEAKVELWEEVLAAVESSESKAELKEKLEGVRTNAHELKKKAIDAQEDALERHASEQGLEASARGRVKAAENKLAEIARKREALLERLQNSERALQEEFQARDRLYHEAVRLVAEANTALEAGNYKEAWVKANEAFKAMILFGRGGMIDKSLLRKITAAGATISGGFDKPMTAQEAAEAILTAPERAKIGLETAARAEAKRLEVLRGLLEVEPQEGLIEEARKRAEAARQSATALTLKYKPQLSLVVVEKIKSLAMQGEAAMESAKYGEAARLFYQIVVIVKDAVGVYDPPEETTTSEPSAAVDSSTAQVGITQQAQAAESNVEPVEPSVTTSAADLQQQIQNILIQQNEPVSIEGDINSDSLIFADGVVAPSDRDLQAEAETLLKIEKVLY